MSTNQKHGIWSEYSYILPGRFALFIKQKRAKKVWKAIFSFKNENLNKKQSTVSNTSVVHQASTEFLVRITAAAELEIFEHMFHKYTYSFFK